MASFLWPDLRFRSTTRPLSLTVGPTPTVLTLNPPVVAEGVASLRVPGLGAVCLSAPVDREAGAVQDDRPLQVGSRAGGSSHRGSWRWKEQERDLSLRQHSSIFPHVPSTELAFSSQCSGLFAPWSVPNFLSPLSGSSN